MEVILLERVEKLGAIGDVVKVKDGFARNYLLPNKKALRANDSNRKLFEANRARIEQDNAEQAHRRREIVEGRRRQDRSADPPGVEHRPALWLGVAPATSSRRSKASARRSPRARWFSTVRSRRSACTK